jgi:hypothetical protein
MAIMVIVALLISGETGRGRQTVWRVLLLVIIAAGVTVASDEIDWGLTTLNPGRKLFGELVKERGGYHV